MHQCRSPSHNFNDGILLAEKVSRSFNAVATQVVHRATPNTTDRNRSAIINEYKTMEALDSWGNKCAFAVFSEPTGQFEAVIFSETLAASRPLLEAGTAVLLNVEGERDGEALKLRVQTVQSLDEAANGVQRGLKVVIDADRLVASKGSLDSLRESLKPSGKGLVEMHLRVREMGKMGMLKLQGRDISPARKSELSAISGVLEVVDF